MGVDVVLAGSELCWVCQNAGVSAGEDACKRQHLKSTHLSWVPTVLLQHPSGWPGRTIARSHDRLVAHARQTKYERDDAQRLPFSHSLLSQTQLLPPRNRRVTWHVRGGPPARGASYSDPHLITQLLAYTEWRLAPAVHTQHRVRSSRYACSARTRAHRARGPE